jgi:multicomponent Na+:H+ antiporter subunit D
VDSFASVRLLAAVLTALVGAGLIVASSRRPNLREAWTLAAAFTQFGLVLSLLPAVLRGQTPSVTLLDLSPGVSFAFRADPLGVLFALSASLLYILTAFYAIGYMRGLREHRQTRFFAFLAVCLSATMGLALAANLLTFIVCYEVLTIATWPLVTHKGSPAAEAAGRKYLLYLLPAGVALIPAAALTLAATGTLEFIAGGVLTPETGRGMLLVIFALFVVGFGVKAGVMPLHGWLPTAMIAPTPVSALLHAVAVVKAGVFGIARVAGFVFSPALLQDIGAGQVLAVVAGSRHHRAGIAHRHAPGRSQGAAGLLDHRPPVLHRARDGRSWPRSRPGGRAVPHRGPRRHEDHPVLLRRGAST